MSGQGRATSWWDRVRGEAVARPPDGAVRGRYVIAPEAELNVEDLPVRAGDQLFGESSGRWSSGVLRGEIVQGRFAMGHGLGGLERWAIGEIPARLGAAKDGTTRWTSLTTASPFVGPAPEHLEETVTDRALAQHGRHLRGVFRDPYTELDTCVEPMPASRARRIAPRAVTHLAQHSEDWQRRVLTGVVPRRILAERVEERLDIYENRVAVSVVEGLLVYFTERLEQLGRIIGELEKLALRTTVGDRYQLTDRLAALWGGAGDLDSGLAASMRLKDMLLTTYRPIAGLQDTPLYRAVPRQALRSEPLHDTNVLTDHKDYRQVTALWRVLDQERAKTGSRQAQYIAWQALTRAYDAYCLLLVARAAERLGLRGPEGQAIDLGHAGEVALTGPGEAVATLAWEPWRGITLTAPHGASVRFVGLVAALSGEDDARARTGAEEIEAQALALTAPLSHDASEPATIVLYPGSRQRLDALSPALRRTLNADDAGLPGRKRLALLPASPLDLFSLERIERVVRRVFLLDLYGQIPPRVRCARIVREALAKDVAWLDAPEGDRDHLTVRRTLDAAAVQELEAVIERITQRRSPQRAQIAEALKALPREIGKARAIFDRASICPVCAEPGTLTVRDRGFVAAHLPGTSGCRAEWGVGDCGNCHAGVPYLKVDKLANAADAGPAPSEDRLDQVYGRDVLAIPCPSAGGTVFVCPSCHVCPNRGADCGGVCAT